MVRPRSARVLPSTPPDHSSSCSVPIGALGEQRTVQLTCSATRELGLLSTGTGPRARSREHPRPVHRPPPPCPVPPLARTPYGTRRPLARRDCWPCSSRSRNRAEPRCGARHWTPAAFATTTARLDQVAGNRLGLVNLIPYANPLNTRPMTSIRPRSVASIAGRSGRWTPMSVTRPVHTASSSLGESICKAS